MSWIVERLLIDKHLIRSEHPIESDTFNRLLSLEKKISDLYKDGYITDQEMQVIRLMSEGYSVTEVSNKLGFGREKISNIFRNACNRISFHLGGSYTDQGFLEDIQKNYNLTNVELEKVRNKIFSKHRHRIKHNRSDI